MSQFTPLEKKNEKRHDQLQFPNPMKMTPFEEALAIKEQIDRKLAKMKYSQGIQGEDGGCFPGRYPS